MVEIAVRNARERGLSHFEGVVGDAGHLHFAGAAFDIVTCRYAAHHFVDLQAVVQEVARVLKPGGRLVVVDTFAPDTPALDRWLDVVQRLRDPFHVRDWSNSDWTRATREAGLSYQVLRTWMLPLEFEDWTTRQQVPPDRLALLQALFVEAGPFVREAFQIDGPLFALPTRLVIAEKPSAVSVWGSYAALPNLPNRCHVPKAGASTALGEA